jgi:hypothetical protein
MTAMVYFDAFPFAGESLAMQIAFSIILGLPFMMAMVGFLVVYSGRHSFHIAPRSHSNVRQAPPSHRSQESDPLIHLAVGILVSLLQDFSEARIINYDVYASQFRGAFEQELSFFRVYFDRGYSFHFDFYHQEPYEAFIRQKLSDSDVVVEIAGFFDYYFEREGEKHPTPHEYDQNPPLMRVPARMHLRLQKNETAQWQLVGFSDSIRGLKLGLSTG